MYWDYDSYMTSPTKEEEIYYGYAEVYVEEYDDEAGFDSEDDEDEEEEDELH